MTLPLALTAHLKATGDPRETTGEAPWDAWPYYGRHRWEVIPALPAKPERAQ